MPVHVLIRHAHNHTDTMSFPSYEQARYFVTNHISYSGPSVQRVEIVDTDGATFAMWDREWDDASKAASLQGLGEVTLSRQFCGIEAARLRAKYLAHTSNEELEEVWQRWRDNL